MSGRKKAKKAKVFREGSRRSGRLTHEAEQKAKAEKYQDEYVLSDEEDEDDLLASLDFFNSPKKSTGKKKKSITVTPSTARFSLENLVQEESRRKEVEIIKNVDMMDLEEDDVDDDMDFDDEFAQLNMSLSGLLEEATEKSPDDLDFLAFFHHWSVERLTVFHARAPEHLPSSLTDLLRTDSSLELEKMLLVADWIPSFFPDSCPADVGHWLFDVMCFHESEVYSAAAWDVWTHYFGRQGVWDPDDASFGWFRDVRTSQQVGMEWVPDWQIIVETLGAFGAPTNLYESGKAFSIAKQMPDPPDWPPARDASRGVEPDAELAASFPVQKMRRFFSIVSLGLVASSAGRLGGFQYEEDHAILLIQVCLSALMDPLLYSSSKRELMQCVAAAMEVFPDQFAAAARISSLVILAQPHQDLLAVVSALMVFTPSTPRVRWLQRRLAFAVAIDVSREQCVSVQGLMRPLPSALQACDAKGILSGLIDLFNCLDDLVAATPKPTTEQFNVWHRIVVCLDLVLGDRNAIMGGSEVVQLAHTLKPLVLKVHSRFKRNMMNPFGLSLRGILAAMAERINFNLSFEENRSKSLRISKGSQRIGSRQTQSAKQTNLTGFVASAAATTPVAKRRK